MSIVGALVIGGCQQWTPDIEPAKEIPAVGSAAVFQEVEEGSGLTFRHDAGVTGSYPMPRIMGSGGALFDFDSDGDLDVLLIDGGSWLDDKTDPSSEFRTGSRLFRQDADGKFVDVTASTGLAQRAYGMGVAIGDMNNDGHLDVYFTNYGNDQLFQNKGDGSFVEITSSAGIANPNWATAACFFDYDLDGWLDLFVVNYLDYFPGSRCEDGQGRRDFCGPQSFPGTVAKLYRNLGSTSGRVQFSDVTVVSGIASRAGRGLGLLCRDFNADGRPDVMVANDMQENFLWIQQEHGKFQEQALVRGIARNRLGEVEANMGVISDDLDGDGRFDLFVTHLTGETNTLFRGDQQGSFVDTTAASGLGPPSFPYTGFGVAALDVECDGDLDLAIANGKVKRGNSSAASGGDFWHDYAEPNQLYLNDGKGHFDLQTDLGGSLFSQRIEVSRGLMSGDIDKDGDVDLLVTNCGGPARLYYNSFPRLGNWLTVRVIDPDLNRDAIGARIKVRTGDRTFLRELNPSSSYLSSNDFRVHFGLGKVPQYDSIEVTWPAAGGGIERFPAGETNRHITLLKGNGLRFDSGSQ